MDTLKQYFPLCFFAADPLELPRSIGFLKHNLWFYFAIELFIQINMIDDIEAVFEVGLETSFTLLFIGLILLLNKSTHSYIQVTSSILFCENIVAIFAVPTMVWLTMTDNEFSYALLFLLVIWDFSLVAYVCKKSLGVNIAAGTVISILYFFCTYGFAYGITTLFLG